MWPLWKTVKKRQALKVLSGHLGNRRTISGLKGEVTGIYKCKEAPPLEAQAPQLERRVLTLQLEEACMQQTSRSQKYIKKKGGEVGHTPKTPSSILLNHKSL